MKRIFVLLAALATFSLTGCLGGGSGGGGSSLAPTPISNEPMTIERTMAGATNVRKSALALADESKDPDKPQVTVSADMIDGGNSVGGSVKLMHQGQEVLIFPTGPNGVIDLYSFGPEEGYLAGAKSLTAEEEEKLAPIVGVWYDPPTDMTTLPITDHTGVSSATFKGAVHYKTSGIALNSNKSGLPLDHSTFGAWQVVVNYKGTITLADGTTHPLDINNLYYRPGYTADGANKASPVANDTFTGNVTAMARQEGPLTDSSIDTDKFEPLHGAASLSIGADLTRGDLNLALKTADNADFYNIAYNNIAITGGAISASGAPIVTGSGGRGITMDTNNLYTHEDDPEETYLHGQFYGSNPAAASEAVGAFRVTDRNETTIQGAFGVKK